MLKNKLNQQLERSFEVLNQNKVLNKVYEVVNEFHNLQEQFLRNHLGFMLKNEVQEGMRLNE